MSELSRVSNAFSASSTPLVSAVVTSYNKARYLNECIDSLQSQTYSNLEVIVVNDGSQDETSQVIRDLISKYPAMRLTLVEKKNGGVSDARNVGLAKAQGHMLMVLDGDDKVTPHYVQHAITALREFGGDIFRPNQQNFGNSNDQWLPHPYDRYRIRYDNCFPTPSIFDRRLFDLTGGFKVCLSFCEDWEFWVNCSRFEPKVIESSEVLTCWRNTDDGLHAAGVQGKWREAVTSIAMLNEDCYPVSELLGAHEAIPTLDQQNLAMFEKLDRLHPNNWFLKLVFGLIAEKNGNEGSALDYFLRSRELCGHREWQPYYRLALLCRKIGKPQDAHALFHEVRTRRPDTAIVINPIVREIEAGR